MIRAIESAVLAVCMMGCVAGPAAAQFNYGGGGSRTARAVGPLLTVVDFSFRPPQAPDVSFEYSDPAIGLFYSREGFMGRLVRGSGMDADGDKMTLVDGSVDAWAAVRPFGSPDSKALDVFFPIGLYGDYRKVSKQDESTLATVFEVSVAAIGVGAGVNLTLAGSHLSLRSQPFFGLASRAFGTDTGSSAGYMVDIEWTLPEIRSGLGAYAGWGYRWQRWLLNASAVFAQSNTRRVEYRGFRHAFQIGLTF